ncbi:MAG: thiol-disulfide oxidoreductase DCC family protein [Flavobacteriaceae bacterium]|nr:thiol-disulfide oxidoreductase DCC family protein [Flavobacteriaceae bacterium]
MKKIIPQPLLLFDGVCNLCNSSVQFVIKHDKKQQFIFASLQSDATKEILLQFGETNLNLDSILLITDNKIYSKSSAILRISKLLGGFYSLGGIFYIIPKFIRDSMYDFVAKNRYKWYGKRESCMLPNKELKSRFL